MRRIEDDELDALLDCVDEFNVPPRDESYLREIRTLRKAMKTLIHVRYLAGCASGNGDFADEPAPAPKEWSSVVDSIESIIEEYEEQGQ